MAVTLHETVVDGTLELCNETIRLVGHTVLALDSYVVDAVVL